MADEFDILDIVYDAVKSAGTDLIIYQRRSLTGEKNDHIVINCLDFNEKEVTGSTPVYVNIFIRHFENGMADEDRMKEVKRKVREALDNIEKFVPAGMYYEFEVAFSGGLGEAKEGFECLTIRLNLIIEK